MPKKKLNAKTVLPTGASEGSSVARAIQNLSDHFDKMYYVEFIAEHLGEISAAIDDLARANALTSIAVYGTPDERKIAVELLKRRFEEFKDRKFKTNEYLEGSDLLGEGADRV